MFPTTENACFVIADISGYTGYLAATELDHAQDIIADLMDTVLKCLRPPFRLAKFEGDAVFVYALTDKIDGSMLQDAIETAYFAFRRRLRSITQATSCTCAACAMMQHLDLKFVCHAGSFIKQKMGGREELAGSDVILVHRLLKNAAGERLGGHAYALYSGASVAAAGIDPQAQGLASHVEAVDIFGEVACWVQDLELAWQAEGRRQRSEIARAKAALVLGFDFAAPRSTLWEHITTPGLRLKWSGADDLVEVTQNGRRGVGSTNHCMHGGHTVVEEIIDWCPCEQLTLIVMMPTPGAPKIFLTYLFTENPDGGSHIEYRVAKPKPKDKAFVDGVAALFSKGITAQMAVLRQILEGQNLSPAAFAEPGMPASGLRFLYSPVQ